MSCQTCGYPAETVNGARVPQGHHYGCAKAQGAAEPPPRAPEDDLCEHDECTQPKKEWSGRGAKPKYCADGHK